jgi:hypothetical protein
LGTGIAGPPNEYGAGLDFDYSVWTPGTRVDLVNVNWNNDYRDVVRFANRAALNAYIDSLTSAGTTVNNLTYAKPGQDIYLGIPYNRVNRYNYLRASNPLMPINGDIQKDFYYFILECEYVNPTTTRVKVQLDVWQTYVYDVTWGNCYIERGHIGIANTNQFSNHGRDYLTIPEGLDMGTDLRIVATDFQQLAHTWNPTIDPSDPGSYSVVLITTTNIGVDPGTADNPHLESSNAGLFAGVPSGASVWAFKTGISFVNWQHTIADKPWITQGIVSAIVTPPLDRYWTVDWNADGTPTPMPGSPPGVYLRNLASNMRDKIVAALPARYQILKKFLTYPYSFFELTTLMGNPIVVKPELWNDDDANIREVATLIMPNARIVFYPAKYNGVGIDNNGAEGLNHATSITNLPSMTIVNNMAIGYLAANRNQIAWSRESADWSQQRALTGAQAGYDVASGAMRQRSEASNIDRAAAMASTANMNRTLTAQAGVGALGQFAGGGASGAVLGGTPEAMGGMAVLGGLQAVSSNIQAGIQVGANNENLAINQSTSAQQAANDNTQTGLARDTNVALARFAAKGDYANDIAGINAKVRDANLIQPSISGELGGETLNFILGEMGIRMHYKLIDPSAIRKIGDYWLRYGYAISSFVTPPQDLKVMSKFTYWKMLQTYIAAANVPEGHKQSIRGILEKGVTVWVNPADIGIIDIADNAPIAGISY